MYMYTSLSLYLSLSTYIYIYILQSPLHEIFRGLSKPDLSVPPKCKYQHIYHNKYTYIVLKHIYIYTHTSISI